MFCFAAFVDVLCLNLILGYVVTGYVKLVCGLVLPFMSMICV